MEAIIYVCHGSRVKEACNQAVSFIEKCIETNSYEGMQTYAFLELAEPSIEQAFTQCVEQGAKVIHVVPVLLLTAAHAKTDIPEVLAAMSDQYPSVEVKYGRPIGVHLKMAEIVCEKIRSSELYIQGKRELLVLLVGRGSSDSDVVRDLGEIASMAEAAMPSITIEDCYLTAAKPSFDEALMDAHASSYENVLVIPYLLFTGILMKTMEKRISEMANADKQYELTPYLGYHPFLAEILAERVEEVTASNLFIG